jgi:hypothetical protein
MLRFMGSLGRLFKIDELKMLMLTHKEMTGGEPRQSEKRVSPQIWAPPFHMYILSYIAASMTSTCSHN